MWLVVLLRGKGERKQVFPARGIRELYCTYSSRLVQVGSAKVMQILERCLKKTVRNICEFVNAEYSA